MAHNEIISQLTSGTCSSPQLYPSALSIGQWLPPDCCWFLFPRGAATPPVTGRADLCLGEHKARDVDGVEEEVANDIRGISPGHLEA